MPGGIGPVDSATASACRRNLTGDALPQECGEVGIFYRLSLGRVCYSVPQEKLYFTDSGHVPVRDVLQAAMQGMGKVASIEQLHLDPHRIFAAACRVAVPTREAGVVLTALRLAGAEVILLG